MTVSSQTARNDYTGNGATVDFPVTFRFLENTHLQVLRTVIATNVTTELILDSLGVDGFSVVGAGQPTGGTVTVVTAPTALERLSILRNVPLTQETDYLANDAFPAESHERALDKLTMIVQQQGEVVNRAIVLSPQTTGVSTELPGPVALNLLRWKADLTGLENAQPPAIATVADGAVTDITVSPVAGINPTKIAYTQAGAGAATRTARDKLREWVSAEDYGAVGDGATLDDVAFAAAALLGVKVRLIAGKTYHLSTGVAFVNGTGFICPDGIATIKLKTGPGGFTNVAQGGTRTALDRCVFQMVGTNDNVIEGIEFVTDGVKECCLYPIRTSGGFSSPSQGLRIERVRFRGFSMGVLVGLNTVGTGSYTVKDVEARDCGTSQGIAYWGAGTGQFTVLEIDNDMVAATPSQPGYVENIRGTNILHTGTAVTDFGQQTDILNVAGISGTDRKGPTVMGVYADGVGEVIDMFCTGAVVKGVRARNVHNFVAKFVHGAQNNEVDVDVVESFGLGCVVFAGSASLAIHTRDNVVRIGTVRGCGDAGPGPTTANIPVVLMQENGGSAATCLPKNNLCTIDSVVTTANLDYIVRDNCAVNNSNGNLVKLNKLSGAPAIKFVDTSFSANTKVRYLNAQPCRLSVGAVQALATGVAATVQYQTVQSDGDSLANTGTYTIQPKYPGWYRIYAQSRISGGNATDYATMRVQKNAATVAQRVTYYGTGAVEPTPAVDYLFYVDETEVGGASANYTIQITHVGAAAPNILNTPTMAYFELMPMAG